MSTLFVTLLGIFGPVLAYFLKGIISRFLEKTKVELDTEKRNQAILDFKEQCMRAVKRVDLEFVLPIKEKGEQLTPEQGKQAKDLAINTVEQYYGKDQMVELAMLFSVDAEGLMALIGDTIEEAILLNKNIGAMSLQDEKVVMPDFK